MGVARGWSGVRTGVERSEKIIEGVGLSVISCCRRNSGVRQTFFFSNALYMRYNV